MQSPKELLVCEGTWFFAGLWVPDWTRIRKVKDGETTDNLFGFLTCAPNAEVAAVHPKAMPVILTDRDEMRLWLTEGWTDAQILQRPLRDGAISTLESNHGKTSCEFCSGTAAGRKPTSLGECLRRPPYCR